MCASSSAAAAADDDATNLSMARTTCLTRRLRVPRARTDHAAGMYCTSVHAPHAAVRPLLPLTLLVPSAAARPWYMHASSAQARGHLGPVRSCPWAARGTHAPDVHIHAWAARRRAYNYEDPDDGRISSDHGRGEVERRDVPSNSTRSALATRTPTLRTPQAAKTAPTQSRTAAAHC